MLKDTKSLGNNKAPACESRGFVLKKEGVLFDTPSSHVREFCLPVGRGQREFVGLVVVIIYIPFSSQDSLTPDLLCSQWFHFR